MTDTNKIDALVAEKAPLCACGCGQKCGIAKSSNGTTRKGDYYKYRVGHFSRTREFATIAASVPHSKTKKVGEQNGQFKCGWRISTSGYILVANSGKPKYLHRLIAEAMVGRPLTSRDVVHHVDGDRTNNHPENLMITTQSEHMRLHMKQRKGLAALRAVGVEVAQSSSGSA